MQLKQMDGFTIVELIIVIAIVGILATVALPKFVDLSQAAKIAATKASLETARSAVRIYNYQAIFKDAIPKFPNPPQLNSNDYSVGSTLQGNFFEGGQIPLNQIVGRKDFFGGGPFSPTCADLQNYYTSFNAGWLVDVTNGRVWATTNDCTGADTTNW